MCHQGGEICHTHHVNKGDKLSTWGRNLHFVHSFERDCTCSGGVALELLLLARCVESLPFLEGLAVFGFLSFASGVEPVASS
jgi:hypothetical protein